MEQLITGQKRKKKQDTWAKHIEQQQSSDLTQAAYCSLHGLKLHNFYYWKKKLESRTAMPSRLRFVPMSTVQPEPSFHKPATRNSEMIRMIVGEIVLELPETISAQRLGELVCGLQQGGNHVAH